ncbi:MAG: GGDEF domain-containing protein [Oceanospirillales bacterium]|nr:MAG: GGDEF domain-containing protein [Oceanospirillales bacterium]
MAGTIQLNYSYNKELASATERANSKSFLVAEWIDKSFEIPMYVLRNTARSFPVEELVFPTNDLILHKQKTQLIIDKVNNTPNLVFLGMLNKDCIVTHTSIGINLGFDGIKEQREYCTLAMSEPITDFKLSNMFVSVDNTMNVTMSYPLISTDGKLDGFALAGLDLQFFQQWLDFIEQDQDDVITIYDLNSRLLARNPYIEESIGIEVTEQHLNRMAKSKNETHFSHRLVSPVDGVDRVWSLRRIGDLPFMVVVGEPTTSALNSWRQLLLLYIVAGGVLFCAVLFGTREYIRNVRQANKMEHLAVTDFLTGVANRRHFINVANSNLSRSVRSGLPVALIMVDIDHFKRINDTYGHAVGDQVLISISNLLKRLCRQSDLIARWGGEEFTILLPDTEKQGAFVFAERIADEISQLELPESQKITISQGIAMHNANESFDEILKRADTALYRAKELGRNRIEFS